MGDSPFTSSNGTINRSGLSYGRYHYYRQKGKADRGSMQLVALFGKESRVIHWQKIQYQVLFDPIEIELEVGRLS